MEYERIQKPTSQGGGISPSKLRFMLLGVEKKRKEEEDEEEEVESRSALRSETRGSISEPCKDVDVVTSNPKTKDPILLANSKSVRFQDEDGFDSDTVPSGVFEFQRAERRAGVVPPFSKPAPSKWDDAQKWIASPTSNRHGGKGGAQGRRSGGLGYGNRQPVAKVVMEVMDEPDTKRIDLTQVQVRKEGAGQKGVSWAPPDPFAVADAYASSKPALFFESSTAIAAVNRSQHDSSTSVQSDTAYVPPASTVRSVSMRDMGTEMTPIASQEPSRNGTPIRATTPIRSPTSSIPVSPRRIAVSPAHAGLSEYQGDDGRRELTERELKLKTRREIMALGTKLGKTNIAAWASKAEEDKDAFGSLKGVPVDAPEKRAIEIRAAAWEEAEKAKYLARFKREEIKIQAWENHQKAKAEAEMRKVEVEVERTRANAHDRLLSKLASARHKAEQKLAVAESKKNRQAEKAAEQAEYIRITGQVPSSFSCGSWCS